MKKSYNLNKKIITGIFGAILFMVLISSVLAADYCWLKMSKNQKIHISQNDYYTCKHTTCQVCAKDGWYASWNKCYNAGLCSGSGTGNPLEQPLSLTADFPFSNGGVFTKQNFFMDITTNKIASISLIDNIAGEQKNLCPNCMEYRKSATFRQGPNDITIRAVKGNEIKEKRITFFIDNQKPRITKTLPLNKKYASTEFSVFYDENNIKKIELNYGAEGSMIKKELIGCGSGKKQECSVTADLKSFDGQEISYWFTITDIAINEVSSKPVKIIVDETAPVINSFDYLVDNKRKSVNFAITITEQNFGKIVYYDNDEERAKILCSTLKNNLCSKKINFKPGSHNLRIEVLDKAGNKAEKTISFEI